MWTSRKRRRPRDRESMVMLRSVIILRGIKIVVIAVIILGILGLCL